MSELPVKTMLNLHSHSHCYQSKTLAADTKPEQQLLQYKWVQRLP
jgi:hypothetical protein